MQGLRALLIRHCFGSDSGEQEEDVDIMTVQEGPLTQAPDEDSTLMVSLPKMSEVLPKKGKEGPTFCLLLLLICRIFFVKMYEATHATVYQKDRSVTRHA